MSERALCFYVCCLEVGVTRGLPGPLLWPPCFVKGGVHGMTSRFPPHTDPEAHQACRVLHLLRYGTTLARPGPQVGNSCGDRDPAQTPVTPRHQRLANFPSAPSCEHHITALADPKK